MIGVSVEKSHPPLNRSGAFALKSRPRRNNSAASIQSNFFS